MIVSSLKVKGFSCFTTDWAGFDEFKPMTLIIGRNNTGKSRLLDLVDKLSKGSFSQLRQFQWNCTAKLDQKFLGDIFSPHSSGGNLSPVNVSHWSCHGAPNVGKQVSWELTKEGRALISQPLYDGQKRNIDLIAEEEIAVRLPNTTDSPFAGRAFRRILADRDIRPEKISMDMSLSSDGTGATNIIRRYITSSMLDEDLIQVELLDALQEVFGEDSEFESIEIQHHDQVQPESVQDTWEIFLREPRKGLVSLSDSGSGLKTVILILLNLIIVPKINVRDRSDYIFAFEELENNLHPALLRRLLKYLSDYVRKWKCMALLTTHSNVALDYFASNKDAQIIHVEHDGSSARTRTISAHFDRVSLITELGARPSDLLQANGIVWLEGPSDRIYLNRFIELYSGGELVEGRDYQCAYYGGSVLAQSQFTDPESENKDLANLLRLNHNIAVICDGDRTAKSGTGSTKKTRVQRIEREVGLLPNAFLWVTEAKELENYIPGEVWELVYEIQSVPDPTQFDSFPSKKLKTTNFVKKHLNRKSFDKCEFATEASPKLTKTQLDSRFDLARNILKLVEVIRSWNA